MFEIMMLCALLGVILRFILASGQPGPSPRAHFIDLSAELRPSEKKIYKK